MKTRIKVLLVMLCVAFFSTTTYATVQNSVNPIALEINNQEVTLTGVYKGHDDSGYKFTIINEKGVENTTTFSSVNVAVAKSNDLNSKSVLGRTYKIKFTLGKDGAKTITALEAQY